MSTCSAFGLSVLPSAISLANGGIFLLLWYSCRGDAGSAASGSTKGMSHYASRGTVRRKATLMVATWATLVHAFL